MRHGAPSLMVQFSDIRGGRNAHMLAPGRPRLILSFCLVNTRTLCSLQFRTFSDGLAAVSRTTQLPALARLGPAGDLQLASRATVGGGAAIVLARTTVPSGCTMTTGIVPWKGSTPALPLAPSSPSAKHLGQVRSGAVTARASQPQRPPKPGGQQS